MAQGAVSPRVVLANGQGDVAIRIGLQEPPDGREGSRTRRADLLEQGGNNRAAADVAGDVVAGVVSARLLLPNADDGPGELLLLGAEDFVNGERQLALLSAACGLANLLSRKRQRGSLARIT
jgi:hypothetical protein